MTNLTTEQYRDVLKRTKNPLVKNVPSIQHLLRLAVENYFRRFGCYPEIAGVGPGKVGLLGDQTEFCGGMALPVATPMATIMVGRRNGKKTFSVVSSLDVGKPHKITFSYSKKRPLHTGFPSWLDYVKGVMTNYPEDQIPGFDALIETSLPIGVGFGSSAALEVAVYTFLEVLIGKKAEPREKAELCQKAEREFPGKEVGLVERLTSICAKDRHAILIDCKTYECEWIPFSNPDVAIMAIDSHIRDELDGDEYTERCKYLDKAKEILGVESLRDSVEEDLELLDEKVNEILAEEERIRLEKEEARKLEEEEINAAYEEAKANAKKSGLPIPTPPEPLPPLEEEIPEGTEVWDKPKYDIMIKRAKFFITEMRRIEDGIQAWSAGDVQQFGKILVDSHRSLKNDFELYCDHLDFLVEASLEICGVFGSRMTGMGLGYGGGVVTLINKDKMKRFVNQLTQKFYAEEEKNRLEWEERWLREHEERMKAKREEKRRQACEDGYDPTRSGSLLIAKAKKGSRTKVDKKRKHKKRAKDQGERPSIISIERTSRTWGKHDSDRIKEEKRKKGELPESGERKGSGAEGESEESIESTMPEYPSKPTPTFYVITPFPGARMSFVTKPDYLRSLFSEPVPDPKILMREATEHYEEIYGRKADIAGLAPASVGLFGEFMEYHLGNVLQIALPMMTAVAGSRNDSVYFSFKTTAPEIEDSTQTKFPVPCVRPLERQESTWANYTNGAVTHFRGHVPGFDAVITSSIPCHVGVNSCSALQASIYTFLEALTKQKTEDLYEKADRCQRSEYEFRPEGEHPLQRCSILKYFPTLLAKEGHAIFVDSKNHMTDHYFIDDPAFVFLIATVKEITTELTLSDLIEKTRLCCEAAVILGKATLRDAEEKHIRCLIKRDAPEEMVKVARYIITEHKRTDDALEAMKNQDYPRLGLLMTESHKSLRDHYGVSCPEVDEMIELALHVPGVLGAKLSGKGLNGTIIILVRITCADHCIRYMRRKYPNKEDKPIFYVVKPWSGAYSLDMNDLVYIP